MKKTVYIFCAALLFALASGCASSGRVILDRHDEIALVSVVCNDDINWTGEDPVNAGNRGLLSGRYSSRDPDRVIVTSAKELINTAETLFRGVMADSGKINLAGKETVLSSRAYREAAINRHQADREMLAPDNYRLVDFRDKNFPAALAGETGIQRSMFVEFTFTKTMSSGFGKSGNCRADITMVLFVLDARGKTLYRKTLSLGSGDSTKVSGGAYSKNELLGLFESTVVDISYEHLDRMEN